MITSSIQKIAVSLTIFIILALLGYYVFTTTPPQVIESTTTSEEDLSSQRILMLVDQINNISTDQSIFTSELFTNLVDYQIPLVEEGKGRAIPFAPIGFDSVSGVDSTASKVKTSTR
jgi:uncharacterized membrane protein